MHSQSSQHHSAHRPYRVGIIGFGSIGGQLAQFLRTSEGFQLAFVHTRARSRPEAVPAGSWCADLAAAHAFTPDLIVEAAHPSYTEQWGIHLLGVADYMPVSTSALVDDTLRAQLDARARASGRRLLIPHGALVGLTALLDTPQAWASVSITFTKHPDHVEGAPGVPTGEPQPDGSTVVFDGTVREIARRFPRNVNSMITLALATTGVDACRARLVADPEATRGKLDIRAEGHDGSLLAIRREQPMVGVSGSEMFASVRGSVHAAAGLRNLGLQFV